MPNKNLTDNEIIKALEDKIEFENFDESGYVIIDIEKLKLILDLINRQKAEIERLKSRKEVAVPSMRFIDENPLNGFNLESNRFVARTVEDAKAEAYKEFAERLIEKYGYYDWENKTIVYPEDEINNLLKELVGESNEKT
jgi:hypothetical protein